MNAEATATGLPTLRRQASIWWRARTVRERQMVTLVLLVVLALAVWSLLVQPALRVAREAPVQIDRLDGQLQQMQRVAIESTGLRAAARISQGQATQALKSATDRLGEHGKIVVLGDRATLTLVNADPEALRGWLNEARSGARARPVEAQLQRSPAGYSGTMSLTLEGASR